MSDITKHEWVDYDIYKVTTAGSYITIHTKETELHLNKSDSIVIANHFYQQLNTVEEKNAFLDNITSARDK